MFTESVITIDVYDKKVYALIGDYLKGRVKKHRNWSFEKQQNNKITHKLTS